LYKEKAERRRLQAYILIAGGAGVFLAAILPIWVALTASLTAALIGWQELRNLDAVVRNYSKVRMELGILYDHWKSLEEKEKTQSEFFNMVRSTEEILWSQNVEYIKPCRKRLRNLISKKKPASLTALSRKHANLTVDSNNRWKM
jgi:hypothetical protein